MSAPDGFCDELAKDVQGDDTFIITEEVISKMFHLEKKEIIWGGWLGICLRALAATGLCLCYFWLLELTGGTKLMEQNSWKKLLCNRGCFHFFIFLHFHLLKLSSPQKCQRNHKRVTQCDDCSDFHASCQRTDERPGGADSHVFTSVASDASMTFTGTVMMTIYHLNVLMMFTPATTGRKNKQLLSAGSLHWSRQAQLNVLLKDILN